MSNLISICNLRWTLTVEIFSTKQTVNEITDKVELYLNADVLSCWLMIPPTKTIVVFNEIQQPHSFSDGIISDPKLNIQLAITDVFG